MQFIERFISEKVVESLIKNIIRALIIFSLLITFFSFYNATKWIGKTFPGFLLYNPMIVSDVSLDHWAQNQDFGIKPYDKILKVNGIKVNNSREVYDIVSGNEFGAEINYAVSRGNETLQLRIPSYLFTLYDFKRVFLLEYLVGLSFLLIGSIVFLLRSNIFISRLFYFLCLAFGLWFALDFEYQTNYSYFYYFNISLIGQMLVPSLLVWFSIVFPFRDTGVKYFKYFYFLPISFLVIISVAYFLVYTTKFPWELFFYLSYFLCVVSATIFFIFLIWKSSKSKNLTSKYKSKVVLYGAFFGFILPALIALFIVITKQGNLVYATYPVILFPLSIAYSIIKHKLFDIDIIMQRTVLYGATTGIVAAVFIGVVYVLNSVVSDQINWQSPATVIFFCGLLVVALNPLRDKIQGIVDHMFFRNKYDYRTIVTKISKDLTTILNVDRIADTVVSSIGDSMQPEPCELIILNKKTGHYDSYTPGVKENEPAIIKRSILVNKNRILSFLQKETREIFREDLFSETTFIGKKEELLSEFEEKSLSLVIPVAIDESMLGYLSLGDKKSGKPYNSIDLSLLQTLANQAAIAIENSYALKLIESYSNELEKKNVHLTEVQSQLVHAEKMSSIGQLASGIAHEIRNPLNIIEGARYYLANHLESGTKKDAVAGEYLEYIANEVQRTNRLIDELLLFSKPTNSDITKVNFNSLIDNILILTRKQVNDHSVRIEKIYDPDLPGVYVDSNQIWQVFVNLLINSLESMGSSGHLQIKTGVNKVLNELNKEEKCVYIIFKDNGQGISDDSIEKIFDPFFTTKASGTGLGLSVGYKIINSHNGRVLVNSEVGKGTRFMVEIPVDSTNISG